MVKTLKSISGKTKKTIGWVFENKLLIVIDEYMNLVYQSSAKANIADNNSENIIAISKEVQGDVYGDRGFMVNAEVKKELFQNKFILYTRQRKNAINKAEYTKEENKNFSKRILIEEVGKVIKQDLELEDSRHRSIDAYFIHIFHCLYLKTKNLFNASFMMIFAWDNNVEFTLLLHNNLYIKYINYEDIINYVFLI